MKTITFILHALLALIFFSYVTAAFLLTLSQGSDGEPTIYNLAGLLMLTPLILLFKRDRRDI